MFSGGFQVISTVEKCALVVFYGAADVRWTFRDICICMDAERAI